MNKVEQEIKEIVSKLASVNLEFTIEDELEFAKVAIKKAEQKLKKIEEYCEEQNLKADTTACEILAIIKGKLGI